MKNRRNPERQLNIAISVAVLLPYAVLVMELLFASFYDAATVRMLGKIITGVYFAFTILRYSNRLLPKLLVFAIVFGLLFLIQILIYSDRSEIIENIFAYFSMICLPIFVCSSEISDERIFMQCATVISNITIVTGCAYVLLFMPIGNIDYNMSLGYYMLLPCLVAISHLYAEKQIVWNIIGFVLSLGIILAMGSRGPVLCVAVYVICKEISMIRDEDISIKRLFVRTVKAVAFMGICVFYNDIALWVMNAFKKLGVGSRTIEMLLQGKISYLSNRDSIYTWAINRINERFFLGHGIGYSIQETGTYCHNILLEFAMEYGVPLCGIFVLLIIFIVWHRMKNENKAWSDTLLIWICVGIVPLFVSGLYWTYMQFWCCMGMMIHGGKRIIILKRQIRVTNEHTF